MAEYFIWLSLLPVALLIADVASLFFSRKIAPPNFKPPRLQFWIQDFFVLTLLAAVSLAWTIMRFKMRVAAAENSIKLDEADAFMPIGVPAIALVTVTMGFAIAIDVCSAYPKLKPLHRIILVAALIAASIWVVWLIAMLWFAWKRWRAFRYGPRVVNKLTRLWVMFAVAVYGVAFFLPMRTTSVGFGVSGPGYNAYVLCFESFFGAFGWPTLTLAWVANPCFWAGCAMFLEGRRWTALGLALLAAILALFVHDSDYTFTKSPGYTTWFLSMLALAVCSFFAKFKSEKIE